MQKFATLIIFSLILTITACSRNEIGTVSIQPTNTGIQTTKIRLPMGYIPNVQYAPFYVAAQKGYFEQAGLEIEFDYSFETDGVQQVGADEVQFALVSGEQVLLARAQEIPVVYVMAWWQEYPVGVTAFSDQNINQPQDLEGKKIGIPGMFGASYIGLRALLAAGGLEEEDVNLDSIGFNQVEALLAGQEDAIVVYVVNEPTQLESMGYEIDQLFVADYAKLTSNGIITNEVTIKENPELIRRFVNAAVKGVEYTIANPEEAFEICKKYVEGLEQSDQDVQMQVLLKSIEFWKSEKIGFSDPVAWSNMQDVLLEMGFLSEPLDIDEAYTNAFVIGW